MKHAHLIALVLAAGCVDAPDDPADPAPVTDDTVFYQTVATVTPNGIVLSDPVPFTAAQQRERNERRLAREAGTLTEEWTATLDGACDPNSLWYFDQTNWTGNEICFTGCGTAVMGNYYRGHYPFLATWNISSGSYWPGNAPGVLALSPSYSPVIQFYAWGPRKSFNYAPYYVQGLGVGFVFGQDCPGPQN
jgi:hypothetical protein